MNLTHSEHRYWEQQGYVEAQRFLMSLMRSVCAGEDGIDDSKSKGAKTPTLLEHMLALIGHGASQRPR